jgi:hypothetical protein
MIYGLLRVDPYLACYFHEYRAGIRTRERIRMDPGRWACIQHGLAYS